MSRPLHVSRGIGAVVLSTALAALLASCAENFTTSPVQFNETLSLTHWADTIVLGDQRKLMGRVLDDQQRPVLNRTIQWSATTVNLNTSIARLPGLSTQTAQAGPVAAAVAQFGSNSGGITFNGVSGDSVTVVATSAGRSDVVLSSSSSTTSGDTISRRVTVAVSGVRVSSWRDTTLTAVGDTTSIHATALGRSLSDYPKVANSPLAASASIRSCEAEMCLFLTPFANQGLNWSRVGTGGAVAISGQGDRAGITAVEDGTDTLVVSHPICAGDVRCADTVVVHVVTVVAGPIPGGDVVVFNDVNMWQNGIGTSENNQTFFGNLVSFGGDSARVNGMTVMFHTPLGARCGSECWAPNGNYIGALVTKLTALGYTIVNDSGSLASIPADVKVIFIWTPIQTVSAADVNGLKAFGSEGGRVVIVGENGGYMGEDGLATENKLLADLGALLTNQGGCDVGGETPAVVAGEHQLLTGVTGLNMACASSMTPGPNDYVLFRDPDNGHAVGAVVKMDLTPLPPDPVIPIPY